jgi:drug/metabolite transporter (DMT)-like permease
VRGEIPLEGTMHVLGTVFAFLALASWTFGDFFIQRSVRLVGDIKTIVYIGVVGIISDFSQNLKLTLTTSIFDNAAWIFFASAASLIPISIATTVSESYIAFAVCLGLLLNKEKVQWHQFAGIAIAVASIVALSTIT